ncbi:MAG: tryptophan synthase subunit alpha [Candidatus Omnitrophota bacterium]
MIKIWIPLRIINFKMMNRIDQKFKDLKLQNKKAFIPFLTAGYPNMSATQKIVLELEKNGADIIELGVPFSDPIADGPVIQASSYEALKKGASLKKILAMVAELRAKTQIPLCLMSYCNPILHYGQERFVDDALKAGVDGVIIPDLCFEESFTFLKTAEKKGLHIILFVAPTTPIERARLIAKRSKGFVYFVSLTGVTGTRQSLPIDLKSKVSAVKKFSGKLPICAGFGVSKAQQVKYVAGFCDGVIVGSAIIKKISENMKDPHLAQIVGRFIKGLLQK